ncbi:S41 family peptidase [Parapedobacter tibetensis]|uniref:S41 family peptidase n=1 Tax=Parapedobacter tibetensis TaxID=2972951 RepID=UPI00214DE655|nr:S41 family peptidase [Parapedobacter tibetensis]
MRRIVFLAVSLVMSTSAICQPKNAKQSFNFDFEQTLNGMPVGWGNFGETGYKLSLDSAVVKSGKYAAAIAFEAENPGYRAWMFTIPGSYPGREITLSGYIKTEDVEGFAGLWLRIDPQLAFNNMQQQGLAGTTDWTRYEFALPMNPEKTDQTVLGGLLVGKGKVWFDSLAVTIDGKDIATLEPLEKKKVPAQLDTTFDNGSTISLPVLDGARSENLKVLGLVWGFVKYYHPNIAKGDFNWDYELFRILPSVLAVGGKDERDEVLVKWIGKLRPFEKGDATRRASAEVKLEPDLEWILASGFSDALTALLLDVKDAKRTGEHFYIGMHRGVGNPDFSNESAYPRMQADDDGFRLLALYRYWNMIQYFFPYRHLIGEDWKDVLGEFVPKFAEADEKRAYMLTVLELVGRIHDTHANVWGNNTVMDNFLGERFAPVEVEFAEEQAVVTGYRHAEWGKATGLEVGDVITSINGRAIEGIVKDWLEYTPASNYPTQLRDIAPKLLRTNDSLIRIEFKRDGTMRTTALETFEPKLLTMHNRFVSKDTSFRMLTDEIAYLNNGTLNADDLATFWETIQNAKGLIIDNRNYPQRPGANRVGEFLMADNTPFAKFTMGSVQQPGLFTMTPTMDTGKKNASPYKGKVVILVNEVTQSAAEFQAMSYRVHPNATVIGSTTAAADGNVSPIVLPGGIQTAISGIGVYYPDGRETQRVGIVPDIEAKPTIKGIKAGRDEVLEKAIQYINSR